MGNSVGTEQSYSSGYHILRVEINSPASLAGIEAFFDFILAIDGVELTNLYEQFVGLLQEKEGKPTSLAVYNSKSETVRTVQLVPSRNWGGKGLLGLNIRFCSFSSANDIILHILEVVPNSPAQHAGLVPHSDYIVGYDHVADGVDFFDLVSESVGKPLNLFVYNTDTVKCRDVVVVPSETWGNSSLLGCGIGTGYLHRIPVQEINLENPPVVKSPNIPTSNPPVVESPNISTSLPPMELPPALPSANDSISLPTVPEPLPFPALYSEGSLNFESFSLSPPTFVYPMPEGGFNFFTPVPPPMGGLSEIEPPSDLPVIENFPPL